MDDEKIRELLWNAPSYELFCELMDAYLDAKYLEIYHLIEVFPAMEAHDNIVGVRIKDVFPYYLTNCTQREADCYNAGMEDQTVYAKSKVYSLIKSKAKR